MSAIFTLFLLICPGKVIDDYWSSSLKILNDIRFIEKLKAYDKDNISPVIMKKIRDKLVSMKEHQNIYFSFTIINYLHAIYIYNVTMQIYIF